MKHYYIGMMSGTSLDGVDAVLTEITPHASVSRVISHVDVPLPPTLKKTLHQLNYPAAYPDGELHTAIIAEQRLTWCYANAYQRLIEQAAVHPDEIIAIGAHGQTIRHEPNATVPYTVQLLNGALLSHLTRQTVICDFRRKDIAAGGQGAPLAPLFHRQLFDCKPPFAVVNIGGISNISVINVDNHSSGYDCGPGNCLLDEWIAKHLALPFDKDGQWAAQGQLLPELLTRLQNDPYFSLPPPKSTGRDYFHWDWLAANLCGTERAVDVMRTLTRLTASAIAAELPKTITTVILSGGGAKNSLLAADIQALLPQCRVTLASDWGVDMQQVEALGFAQLAAATLTRQTSDTRQITGAAMPIILGAIYPH